MAISSKECSAFNITASEFNISGDTIPPEQVKLIEKGLRCVRCSEIPNLNYCMICKEGGHILCGKCAWRLPKARSPTDGFKLDSSPSSCCDPDNLEKVNGPFLKRLSENFLWECQFKDSGCNSNTTGKDWMEHVKDCKFRFFQNCYFYQCSDVVNGLKDMIKHFKRAHSASELQLVNRKLTMSILFDEELGPKRRLGLLKVSQEWFLFCAEMFDNAMHIWIWDLQTIGQDAGAETDKKYCVALLPSKRNGGMGRLSFIGRLHPFARSCESIIDSGDCLTIGIPQIKKIYLQEQDKMKFWQVSVTLLTDLGAAQTDLRTMGYTESEWGKQLEEMRDGNRGYLHTAALSH